MPSCTHYPRYQDLSWRVCLEYHHGTMQCAVTAIYGCRSSLTLMVGLTNFVRPQLTKIGARIRIKPNTVIFRDPSAYKDIYDVKANVQKAPFYLAWQKDKEDINTFTISDKHAHSRRRKMLNQSFTEKSLRAAQPFIIEHVDRWNELMGAEDFLDDKWSEPINFARLVDLLVFDIMGDLCFGTSFNVKEPGLNPYKSIPHGIMEYMQFFYPV